MSNDAQGHALSKATAEVALHINDAVRAFTLNYGNMAAHLAKAEAAAPKCPTTELLQIWTRVLSNDPAQLATAQDSLRKLSAANMNQREAAHLAALKLAGDGRWPSAVALLDRHLMDYPLDLVAHQCALRLDGYQGRFQRTASRAARALPFWVKSQPGYGIMLSFYGFGLEELGDYAQAEDVGRQAAELEPYGYWSHHTVSHVLEMTGRPKEGLKWMDDRLAFWSGPECANRVHIWWHKALFHIELGDFDAALAIYDNEILTQIRPVGTQLCNLTALLWRLELLGCEAGDRWAGQHALWQQQATGICSPFNEVHAAMSALRAADTGTFKDLLAGMRRAAASDSEQAPAYRNATVPIVEGLQQFVDGNYRAAVDLLQPVQANLWRMGGSVAQRDVVEWTLTEAAIRAGMANVALSLTNERLALRPESAVNQRFLEEARAARH